MSVLQKKFEFVCFPPFYSPFKKMSPFCKKLRILVGNRQTKKTFKKIKSLNVLDAFSSAGCAKSSQLERVMIVQTHTHDGKNGRFFLFFQKKQ